MTFGAQDGFALILTSDQYMALWNKTHPGQEIADEYDLIGLHDEIRDYSDGNCCAFYPYTPSNSPWLEKLAERMGQFGTAIDAEETDGLLNINKQTVWAVFAPKAPDYFDAPYADLDELMLDLAELSELFDVQDGRLSDEDARFVRDHLAMLGVVTFG